MPVDALLGACETGDEMTCRVLLHDPRFHLSANRSTSLPLIRACASGHLSIVKMLTDFDALGDPRCGASRAAIPRSHGSEALFAAVQNNAGLDVVRHLCDRSRFGPLAARPDAQGSRSLLAAVFERDTHTFDFLSDRFEHPRSAADVDCQDGACLVAAITTQNVEIVDLIVGRSRQLFGCGGPVVSIFAVKALALSKRREILHRVLDTFESLGLAANAPVVADFASGALTARNAAALDALLERAEYRTSTALNTLILVAMTKEASRFVIETIRRAVDVMLQSGIMITPFVITEALVTDRLELVDMLLSTRTARILPAPKYIQDLEMTTRDFDQRNAASLLDFFADAERFGDDALCSPRCKT